MIADEIINIEINRNLFDARGVETLRGLCYTRKGEWEFNKKEFIVELKDIIINGVEIQGDAISLKTRYIEVGFLTESTQEVTENKKINKYKTLDVKKSADIREIKTISFKQEIGTSKKWMGVNIYITDSYNKIKEKVREIK